MNRNRRRVKEFVHVFLTTMGATSAPGVPEEMRAGPAGPTGWCAWQPIDSPITDEDIAALEQDIGNPLPPLFVEYLTYKCLLMTDFGILSLPEVRFDRPLQEVNEYIGLLNRQSYWRSVGYIPFGQDGDGEGVLAFDTNNCTGDGDYAIMSVDPELMAQIGYIGTKCWNNFSELLDDVQNHLLSFEKT